MRPSCPEVGRSQRPDPDAKQRGTAAAVKQRQTQATSGRNVPRTSPTIEALLDQTTTAALPRGRPHLNPRNMQERLIKAVGIVLIFHF